MDNCIAEPKALSVLFFINTESSILMCRQKAFPDYETGIWDYHVVLHHRGDDLIFDFDTQLPFPIDRREYFAQSFPPQSELPENLRTIVREISAEHFLKHFDSDRQHMLDVNGQALQTFPAWNMIRAAKNPLTLKQLRDSNFRSEGFRDVPISDYL